MTEVKQATAIHKGELIEEYTVTSNGDVINNKLNHKIAITYNQDRVVPYAPMTHAGKKIRPSLPVLIYNSFNPDSQVSGIRQLGFKDGNKANAKLDNLYRKELPEVVTIKEAIIENDTIKIDFNEYTSNEVRFATLQRNIIDLLGSCGLRRRIRQYAIGRVYDLFNEMTDETVSKYELEYIMNIQREKAIESLPLFTSETLVGIYNEYCDILPIIDSSNIREVVYKYIEDMRANAIISLEVTHTGTIVQLKDFTSPDITYSVNIDPLKPMNAFLAIIRLRNILKVNFNPETLIPLY